MNPEKLSRINTKAADIAGTIKVLDPLSWPAKLEGPFLEALRTGQKLPHISYPTIDYKGQIRALEALNQSFTPYHPAEQFTRSSIESYILAARMVESINTSKLQEYSIEMFGKPGDKIPGMRQTNIGAAERLIDIAKNFSHPYIANEPESCVSAEEIAAQLREGITKWLGPDGPSVEISSTLSAKASAGAKRIRIKAGTGFNRYDYKQLLVHEVLTHSLTAINGLAQPILKTLGRGAPRTTGTQEGLATFAEVITGSIHLNRLLRLALRIIAIDRALHGADFRETYRFFIDHGQSEKDSFWSAARIFRGGQPDKNTVFTKDAVYLDGLIKVNTLFRWALLHQRLGLVHLLFCGRLTIEDCFLLEESLSDGIVSPPKYVPEWYQRIEGLAGALGFSMLQGAFNSEEVETYFAGSCKI
jgi:uncharacterized protein (TIGR02421 family)